MTDLDLNARAHRRYNPLTEEWVLVSPQRTERPWQGLEERLEEASTPAYDPQCYLCPGNVRAGGVKNPHYTSTFVFDNDFAALLPGNPSKRLRESELIVAESEAGHCRVVCFSPRHDLTLARMEISEIRYVVDTWCDEFRSLGSSSHVRAVQIFENRGAIMGCSNPHPHGQIWGTETIPGELAREIATQGAYFQKHGFTMLRDYLAWELEKRERIVCSNDHFTAVVPFWAIWPFEILLVSRRCVGSLLELVEDERSGLSDILRQITIRYDNLFETLFPYTMGFHQQPTDGGSYPGFHLHAHFYPPLLRSATIRKFMVGYELLAMPQRDLTPEFASAQLRAVPSVHYLKKL